jgi:hypothetical protein
MVTSFECFGSVTSLLSIHLSHTARPLLFIWSCEWSKEGLCTNGAREGTCVFLITFWLQQMMSTKSNDGSSLTHWCDSLFSTAIVSWKSCHKLPLTIIFVCYLAISNSWAAESIEDLMLDFFIDVYRMQHKYLCSSHFFFLYSNLILRMLFIKHHAV